MKRTPIIPIRVRKNILLKANHDTDWDGVPNRKDCQPLNPRKQGLFHRKDKHEGELQCIRCDKWFPRDKVHFEKRDALYKELVCSECGKKVKKEYLKKKKASEEHFKEFDKKYSGEILQCQTCHRRFYSSMKDANPRCPGCSEGNYLQHVRYIKRKK